MGLEVTVQIITLGLWNGNSSHNKLRMRVVSSPTVNYINWAMVYCIVSMMLVSSKCFLGLVLCFSYYRVPTGQGRHRNEHNGVLVTEKQPLLDRLIEGQTFLLGKVFYHWIDGGMSSKGVWAVQLVSTKSGLSGRWMGEWAPYIEIVLLPVVHARDRYH